MKKIVTALLIVVASIIALGQTPEAVQGKSSEGHIFVVRHAERVDDKTDALSATGEQRAWCLAATLKDAKVTAVITSTFQRTQQTAAPTAKEFNVNAEAVTADDFTAIAVRARAAAPKGDVLIVGHSNTVPQIVKALSNQNVTVGATDYDKLFVLGDQELLQLHYCPASSPGPESRMK
jgi:phosphohistidine phosphatase SixA